MAVDAVTPAVLQYIDHNAFPDVDVEAANLGTDILANLLKELRQEQNKVKDEIRTLSKDTAPDVDTWIVRAKELQEDIVRSRDTARQIVAEHEAGRKRKAQAEDTRRKVQLLEHEVLYEETLAATLEHVRFVNGALDVVQREAVASNLKECLRRLEEAEESIGGLEGVRETKAWGLLQVRAMQLRDGLGQAATECWGRLIRVDYEARRVTVKETDTDPAVSKETASIIDMNVVVEVVKGLGLFEGLVQKLSKDLERTIFRSCLVTGEREPSMCVSVSDKTLSCSARQSDTTYDEVFGDLTKAVDFLATKLPTSVTVLLSQTLVQAFSNRLEDQWLEPAVPLGVEEMPAFQSVLGHVQHLTEVIDGHKWHGTRQLHDWVDNAPGTWLTKRREAVLGDVRNLVFAGLRQTKTVERVETQMVTKEDHQALQGTGEQADDEWDTAWDEAEDEAKTHNVHATASEPTKVADDETGAWDTDEVAEKPVGGTEVGEDEGEAWGWGDDEQHPPSPEMSRKAQPASPPKTAGPLEHTGSQQEREMTLRETFTVTAVPDGVVELIQQIISDAQILAKPAYADSPIFPAATALYTIPTLALAIYRATAPTAYSRLPTGNMLIYNDATHLSSRLRTWQATEPPSSRLRLDNDVAALETFAKRAYTSEMESQRTILRDLLDGAQGFSSVTKPPFKQEAEDAVDQTVHRLRDVHRQWTPVLSASALHQSLGSLLSTITTKIIAEICDLGDIGEEDSHQLRHLMDLVSETKEIFTQQKENGESADLTFIYCPNWLKFQYLAEILESSLADIKFLWFEGELSLEFEGEEVLELIEGLFADSEIRRRAIGEIRRSGK
ncbi:hypothetical protein LTR62_003744 [Meristemomyces frigidus]|uniref:ZW10 C-terminal helical domain-containing protein n=1 Tax=Meristemomyces frigidus TaxID=1508187 RepID=A0AAN7YRL0_9PEZI|nr:hypothetical protein LTR62_003744 [Meristemomyces frigidus]